MCDRSAKHLFKRSIEDDNKHIHFCQPLSSPWQLHGSKNNLVASHFSVCVSVYINVLFTST